MTRASARASAAFFSSRDPRHQSPTPPRERDSSDAFLNLKKRHRLSLRRGGVSSAVVLFCGKEERKTTTVYDFEEQLFPRQARGHIAVRFRTSFLEQLKGFRASELIREPVQRWAQARTSPQHRRLGVAFSFPALFSGVWRGFSVSRRVDRSVDRSSDRSRVGLDSMREAFGLYCAATAPRRFASNWTLRCDCPSSSYPRQAARGISASLSLSLLSLTHSLSLSLSCRE